MNDEESYQTLGLYVQTQYLTEEPAELGWQEHELYARPGMQFDVHGIKCLNVSHEVFLHEVRIGTDDFKLEGPLDIAVFHTASRLFVPMRLGIVTDEVPLVLCTSPMGVPAVLPYINLAVFGKESVLDENRTKDHVEARSKIRNGPNIFQESLGLQRRTGWHTKVVQYIEIEVPDNVGNVSAVPKEVAGFEVRRR